MAQLNRKTQMLCFVTETIMTSAARPLYRPPKNSPSIRESRQVASSPASVPVMPLIYVPARVICANLQIDFGLKFLLSPVYSSPFAPT